MIQIKNCHVSYRKRQWRRYEQFFADLSWEAQGRLIKWELFSKYTKQWNSAKDADRYLLKKIIRQITKPQYNAIDNLLEDKHSL